MSAFQLRPPPPSLAAVGAAPAADDSFSAASIGHGASAVCAADPAAVSAAFGHFAETEHAPFGDLVPKLRDPSLAFPDLAHPGGIKIPPLDLGHPAVRPDLFPTKPKAPDADAPAWLHPPAPRDRQPEPEGPGEGFGPWPITPEIPF